MRAGLGIDTAVGASRRLRFREVVEVASQTIVPTARSRELLRRADALLMEAAVTSAPDERFRISYLAALRGAGAMTAALVGGVGRSRNAWQQLRRVGPEFAARADYFADRSDLRAALEAGISREVSDAAADEFLGRVGEFLDQVERACSDEGAAGSGQMGMIA